PAACSTASSAEVSSSTSQRCGGAPQSILVPAPRGTTASPSRAAAAIAAAHAPASGGVTTQRGTVPPTASRPVPSRTSPPAPSSAAAPSAVAACAAGSPTGAIGLPSIGCSAPQIADRGTGGSAAAARGDAAPLLPA